MIRNIGANWIQLIVSIAVAYYLTPFTLHHLGHEQYGTWLLITALTGYLSLLVLGLPMASVRFVAKHARDPDPTELNRAVANCLGICGVLGLVAVLAGGVAFAVFTSYPISPALWPSAQLAFVIIVVNTALGFVGQLPLGILAAHEQFVTQNKILLGSLLTRFVFTVTLLRFHPTFVVLAASLSLSMLIEAVAGAASVRARYPHIRPRLADINWETTRAIFGFSLYVLLLAVGSQLAFQTDAIVIGKILGVQSIPYFATASLIAIYLMQLIIGIAAVVMPTAARLHADGGLVPLRDIFLKWSKICLSLTLLASIYLLVIGPQFLGWWLGADFIGPGGGILRILTIGNLVFLPARGVALPILMGIGNPRMPAIGFVAAGIVNLALSIVLGHYLGISGVAIGTIVPNMVFAALLIRSVCRTLGVEWREYFGYVVARPLVGALPVMATLYLATPLFSLEHFGGLFLAGVMMVTVFATAWVIFVYRGDRYIDLSRNLRSILFRQA